MYRPLVQKILLCLAMLLVLCGTVFADDSEARRGEAPYFRVNSGEPGVDRLPLQSTRAQVRIQGVIADIAVTQRYRNEGVKPIEARYVFPGSTQSAVHALNVRLGNRLIKATIRERQKARIEYEQAKREGKTSALLEQERPNVFSMNVANILPGDDVVVELHYTELLVPNDGRYQFVFPTVVGPRYTGGASEDSSADSAHVPFPAIPYLHAGEPSQTQFDLDVRIDAPLMISEVRSPSHSVEVLGMGTRQAQVALRDAARANDRDFILDYSLRGEAVTTGLMLHKGDKDDENYFLALVEPPKRIATDQINPRDYIFVVDVSGSMYGYPLDTAKTLLRNLIGHLRPSDTFNVMLFSGGNKMLNETSVPATTANIEMAMDTIDRSHGSGGTEIVPALRRIAALPRTSQLSRTVIVVTDGYVSVEAEVFALIRRNLNGMNVFAFGIGTSVNRHLIEGIARAGQGEPFIVTKPEEAARQAERLRHMIDSPVLTQLHARFEGMSVYDVEPAVLPDVLGGRPVVVRGKWRGEVSWLHPARMVLEGQGAKGAYRESIQAWRTDGDSDALRILWARGRIQELSDEEGLNGGGEQRDAITKLGLAHSLLTQYTSFIAVDHVVRTREAAVTVNQPSPMPAGVTDAAVGDATIGAAVPSTPEPATWLALAVAGGLLGATLLRGRLRIARDERMLRRRLRAARGGW